MKKRRHSLRKRVHSYLVPHKGNQYSPRIFAYTSVVAIVLVLVLMQAVYFLDTHVVFKRTNFLSSVLPGVLITLTNGDRASQNLSILTEDELLTQAAQLKANDMAAKGYFAHVTPEGYEPWYWFDAVGYQYEYAGENLAVNFTDSKDVQTAWMNSPTHRANIVKPQYSRIGIATAEGEYKGRNVTFVVQLFAKPAVAEPVTATPPPTPPQVIDEATVAVETTRTDAGVLGAETAHAPNFLERVAASPNHTMIYLLSGLALFFALILAACLVIHVSFAYVEVLGSGFALLLIVLGFLMFNIGQRNPVEIPTDTQSAQTAQ